MLRTSSLLTLIASKFESLNSLTLSDFYGSSPSSSSTSPPSASLQSVSKLRSLSCKDTYFDEYAFNSIVDCWKDSLQEVSIDLCSISNDSFLYLLKSCGPSLRKLKLLTEDQYVIDDPFICFNALVESCNQGHLTELHWSKINYSSNQCSPEQTWEATLVLLRNNPGLKSFRFDHYPKNTNVFGWLGEHCLQLEECVIISSVLERVDSFPNEEEDFLKLARGCRLLKKLVIDGTIPVTVEGLMTFSRHSKELRTLKLRLSNHTPQPWNADEFGMSCQENQVIKIKHLKLRYYMMPCALPDPSYILFSSSCLAFLFYSSLSFVALFVSLPNSPFS
jgi:hypothetical protein